jgi:diguanylate cyclase (GGDEF)-like protein
VNETILVVDDDQDTRIFLDITLSLAGYEVVHASDGADGIDKAVAVEPDVVLLDVMMPRMDGLDALRRLRRDGRTCHLPVIVLTARTHANDKVSGLSDGADDYVTKPFDPDELIARIEATIRRSSQMRTVSPLTGLPGNTRIELELARRIEETAEMALLYADLNHFKAYNDHYGFLEGDAVLRAFARVLTGVAAEHGGAETFVGHVGGDDFVVVTGPATAEVIAKAACERFDALVPDLYTPEDRGVGYIEVADRRGRVHRYGPLSVSIGIATGAERRYVHASEPVAIATEMKRYAKAAGESCSNWAADRRADGS